mmetsp:Transcript_4660/g.7918  ORF Transcript_4660/g.7918 Transcript_4660/m.7918 type:complete len:82 (+) Transcript_4660:2087-2332(+)
MQSLYKIEVVKEAVILDWQRDALKSIKDHEESLKNAPDAQKKSGDTPKDDESEVDTSEDGQLEDVFSSVGYQNRVRNLKQM